MTGGEIVRAARARHGMSQQVLAERAGTTQSSIARLERGRIRVSFAEVERLVGICGYALQVDLVVPDEVVDRLMEGVTFWGWD